MGYPQGGPPQGYQPQPQPQRAPSQIDFQKIMSGFTTGELVIGGALVLWIIVSFFDSWLSVSVTCPAGTPSAFCANVSGGAATIYHGWGIVAFILWLATLAFFVLRKFLGAAVSLPALPVPDAYVFMGLGGAQLLFELLFWLEYKGDQGLGTGYSVGFGWAWFIGAICSIAIIVGGYLKMQDPAPVAGGPTPGGGYGAYAGYQQQPGYVAPPQPGYPAQPPAAPYGDPSQQAGYGTPQQPGYGAPQQPGYPQQGGYPPQQPPTGYPPAQ